MSANARSGDYCTTSCNLEINNVSELHHIPNKETLIAHQVATCYTISYPQAQTQILQQLGDKILTETWEPRDKILT